MQELVLSRTAAGLVVFCWSAVSWAQATPTVVQWVEIFQEVRQHLMFNGLDIRYSKALAKNVGYTPIGVVLNEGFGCAVVIAEGENPKMPVVLSREEVSRLIAAAWNLKHQTALAVAYGTGLRASEVIALKVGDIDSQRMTLRIEQGKGRKDRYPVICRLHQSYRAP